MNKKLKKVISASMLVVVTVVFASCAKDVSSPADKSLKNSSSEVYSFTETDNSTNYTDSYTLIDANKNMWQWKRFEGGNFVFDIDMIWIADDSVKITSYYCSSAKDSIRIGFSDGSSTILRNIVTKGNHTSFQVITAGSYPRDFDVDFPKEYDFVETLGQYAVGKINNTPWNPLGPIIKAVEDVVDEIKKLLICQYEVGYHAAECAQHDGCLPMKHLLGVTCTSISFNNSEEQEKCAKYDFVCDLN